jgi:hypothetical protein
LRDDEIIIAGGRVESSEGTEITLILDEAKRIADAVPQMAKKLSITLPTEGLDERYFDQILTLLGRSQGRCQVYLKMFLEGGFFLNLYSQPLRIEGSSNLEHELREHGCWVDWIL